MDAGAGVAIVNSIDRERAVILAKSVCPTPLEADALLRRALLRSAHIGPEEAGGFVLLHWSKSLPRSHGD